MMRQRQTNRPQATFPSDAAGAGQAGSSPRKRTPGVVALTDIGFAAKIDGHPFAVVAFGSPSSAASRDFAPAFAAAAASNPDILFATVDADEERAIVAQLNIRSIPTLMIFRSNVVVRVHAGALSGSTLAEVLRAAKSLDMDDARRRAVSVNASPDALSPAPRGDARGDDSAVPSIEAVLRPAVRAGMAEAGRRVAAGALLVIRDAFEPAFAERMHRGLDGCGAWRPHEGSEGNFHFRHHNLYDPAEYPAELAHCGRMFESAETKAWVSRLSGRDCSGPTEFSASLYLPGDHSLPHNDVAAIDPAAHRQVAYVWHLSKDWRPEWGGALYWCAKAVYLPPAFNTLYLFNVGPESNHFVTGVSPYARGKRLAINGWWTGAQAVPAPRSIAPERIGANDADMFVY